MASLEWNRTRGSDFPSPSSSQRSWIHTDEELRRGVSYNFRYIGSLEILESMRSMEFTNRSQVAKESISRVCEAAGIRTVSKKKRVEKRIAEVLGQVDLSNAGADVSLVVDTERIQILTLDRKGVIASHDLPDISFASGGDNDTIDFMAYVGKSSNRSSSLLGRWCYVLECGADLTQECVSTIGHAFDIRFRQYLRASQASLNTIPHSPSASNRYSGQPTRGGFSTSRAAAMVVKKPLAKIESVGDAEYYNDMPGKMPPPSELQATSTDRIVPNKSRVPPLTNQPFSNPEVPEPVSEEKKPDSNLIDLNSPSYDRVKQKNDFLEFEQVATPSSRQTSIKDPFDVTKVEQLLQTPLGSYSWYHGQITRQEAEHLLKKDGDFLIRAGKLNTDGIIGPKEQYVLSGMHNSLKCHILLVDYDGVIRARNQIFRSIPQLVELHCSSREPIVSGDSEIFLLRPIPVAHAVRNQ